MIRFIDLREQDTGYRFAWWTTITDTFLSFAGCEAWDDMEDFKECFDIDGRSHPGDYAYNRFAGLAPRWAFDKEA
jgi:hypothetical protein